MSVLQSESIVLSRMAYKETSYIVNLYTRDAGRVDGIVSGVRKKNARISAGLLQPGTLVEMQCSFKEAGKLQRIGQLKPHLIYKHMLSDVRKSAVALFVGELLKNILKTSQNDEDLYFWIKQFFIYLDLTKDSVANFPIYFLAELTVYLGIQPSTDPEGEYTYFDLLSGVQTEVMPDHLYYIQGKTCKGFSSFIELDVTEASEIELTGKVRRDVLQSWLDYYRLHLDSFKELKSLDVLQSIFSI